MAQLASKGSARYPQQASNNAQPAGTGQMDSDSEPDVPPNATRVATNQLGTADAKGFNNMRVYEAFSDLHALAQKFAKPFDSPAILVVGQQTDGKSALLEALLGLQFNDVGGGTKTRRPLTLHMRYNPACTSPRCCVLGDDGSESGEVLSLSQLQEYIQQENARLHAADEFSTAELQVQIEYKHAPQLVLIDTPGLIAAPPGKAAACQQAAARRIQDMVLAKACSSPELILLCLEDSSDWANATTRKVIMQVDPGLSRTVLVSTKLDARLATFSRGSDADTFINPSLPGCTPLGGGPFFTSVPAGRVGSGSDCVFGSHADFRAAVGAREAADVAALEQRLQRRLDGEERLHVGVSALRSFLERLLQARYMDRLPGIMPLLHSEHAAVSARLVDARSQLGALNHTDLKDGGRRVTDAFLTALGAVLRGNADAPPERYGQTLADEHMDAGSFVLPSGVVLPVPDSLENAGMRLYGGAQFHRAMAEFRTVLGQLVCPDLSREEVANACGLEDAHDGANYMRTACVIAVSKARAVFEPFIHQLARRLSHVLRRMLPPVLHMLREQLRSQYPPTHLPPGNTPPGTAGAPATATSPHPAHPYTHHSAGAGQQGGSSAVACADALPGMLSQSFHNFVDEVSQSCKSRCLEDLYSTTRYVTWSLHTRSARALRAMLSRVKVPPSVTSTPLDQPTAANKPGNSSRQPSVSPPDVPTAATLTDLLEQILFSRQLSPTSEELVSALVAQTFEGIRDFVVQAAELKFNCFFLMPVVDVFPGVVRGLLERAYESDVEAVFHSQAAAESLATRVTNFTAELHQVERLQRKFASIQATLAGGVSAMSSLAFSAAVLATGDSTAQPATTGAAALAARFQHAVGVGAGPGGVTPPTASPSSKRTAPGKLAGPTVGTQRGGMDAELVRDASIKAFALRMPVVGSLTSVDMRGAAQQ